MTNDIETRLAEIRARAEKATEGPWTVQVHGSGSTNVHIRTGDSVNDYGAGMLYAALILYNADAYSDGSTEDGVQRERYRCADFIAHARTDVPWLVEQVERLREDYLCTLRQIERGQKCNIGSLDSHRRPTFSTQWIKEAIRREEALGDD